MESHTHNFATPIGIGVTPWSNAEMREQIPEFLEVLSRSPFSENKGGMGPPHLFLTWFAAKKLKPSTIIESGVWRGAGTWILEQACPDSRLVCLDPNLAIVEYQSPNAEYLDTDFDLIDWSEMDRNNTLLFFDDHQNAFERIKSAYLWGFRHLIFEDNYPASIGDCYSLKKFLGGSGHNSTPSQRSLIRKIRDRLIYKLGGNAYPKRIPSNSAHRAAILRIAEVYAELPPVVSPKHTRFGIPWERIPATPPLFSKLPASPSDIFADSAESYTYLCYLRLGKGND